MTLTLLLAYKFPLFLVGFGVEPNLSPPYYKTLLLQHSHLQNKVCFTIIYLFLWYTGLSLL